MFVCNIQCRYAWTLICPCVFYDERGSLNWFSLLLNFLSSHFWGSDGQPLPAGPQVSPHWHGATFTWARGLETQKHLFTDVSLMPDDFHSVFVTLRGISQNRVILSVHHVFCRLFWVLWSRSVKSRWKTEGWQMRKGEEQENLFR